MVSKRLQRFSGRYKHHCACCQWFSYWRHCHFCRRKQRQSWHRSNRNHFFINDGLFRCCESCYHHFGCCYFRWYCDHSQWRWWNRLCRFHWSHQNRLRPFRCNLWCGFLLHRDWERGIGYDHPALWRWWCGWQVCGFSVYTGWLCVSNWHHHSVLCR